MEFQTIKSEETNQAVLREQDSRHADFVNEGTWR